MTIEFIHETLSAWPLIIEHGVATSLLPILAGKQA